jgi:uncharacterized protein
VSVGVLFLAAPLSSEDQQAQLLHVSKLSAAELSAIRERAVHGDASAQVTIGLAYDGSNRAFKPDRAEARRWYEMAAKQGNLDGRFWLAGMDYSDGKDPALMRSRFFDLAKAGHVGGMSIYANFCAAGIGGAKDFSAAMLWWKKAAAGGSSEAEFNIGVMYLEGEGVTVNEVEGVNWLRRAAGEGSSAAAARLGSMALLGQGQLKPGSESVRWLKAAAEAGEGIAMWNLGSTFYRGFGVQVDYVEAYMWYALAAERGQKDGRPGFRANLTTAQVAEAERRAADWNARHEK